MLIFPDNKDYWNKEALQHLKSVALSLNGFQIEI